MVNFGHAAKALVNALLHAAHAVFLLGNVAEHAVHALLAALHICAQHSRHALALGRLTLRRREPFARLLGLNVLAVHALADASGGGIERLQFILCLLKAFLRLLIFGAHKLRLLMQLIERRHPCRDFLHPELIAQFKVLLCRLRLLFQRADLHFQLLYLVVYAQEVFLRLFKLALRFLFSVAVAGDTGGFLKDLAPVGRAA